MKRVLLFVCAVSGLFWANSCKKCFTCTNECVQCTLTVNTSVFSHTLCNDSFATDGNFRKAISADSAQGYTCTPTASTYSYDFCVNKPGEEDYPNYYNKGKKVTCNEK